jgi:hypothetical protein
MLYTAKCFWPGVGEEEIRLAAARASRGTVQRHAGFRGALYLPADELVLCLFEATSPSSVKSESESAGMPCERVIETVWIRPEREGNPKGAAND